MGYYTLSAYTVRLGELPEAIATNLPRYPLLPATLLGRLAVSILCRGQHLGAFLLMDALYRSWKNTSQVASIGVVVEALDENAHAFYIHHEFRSLKDHPDKLFIAMATIQKAFRLAEGCKLRRRLPFCRIRRAHQAHGTQLGPRLFVDGVPLINLEFDSRKAGSFPRFPRTAARNCDACHAFRQA
jgi:hypothetical protein